MTKELRLILALGAIVGILLFLAGCDMATSGRVTGKEFVPAHSEFSHMQCLVYDSKMNCTASMPMYEDVPDQWLIHLHNDQDDEDGTVSVSRPEYDRIQVGQSFPEAR